jgi:hypothetical protein
LIVAADLSATVWFMALPMPSIGVTPGHHRQLPALGHDPGRCLRQASGYISATDFDRIVNPAAMTGP